MVWVQFGVPNYFMVQFKCSKFLGSFPGIRCFGQQQLGTLPFRTLYFGTVSIWYCVVMVNNNFVHQKHAIHTNIVPQNQL